MNAAMAAAFQVENYRMPAWLAVLSGSRPDRLCVRRRLNSGEEAAGI